MRPERQQLIKSLFDEYIEMYASRDDRLTTRFSKNFSGYAGSGTVLVKDTEEWIRITRQDFAQVKDRIDIEMLDLSMQEIGDHCAIVTAFFHIHLPLPDKFLSHETARLVLVFSLEDEAWMIVHSGISIPYRQADEGEIYPLKSLHERNRELEGIVNERTQALKSANIELEKLSNTDGLTGIANRRHFDDMLGKEWDHAKRANKAISLLMIDVDHFKHYNDQNGHIAGDDCLKTVAEILTNTSRRSGDLTARYGGEEFVVLLPDTNEQDALAIAQRIQNEFRSLALPHAGVFPEIVTVSIGVACLIPSKTNSPENLLQQADQGLYRAKQSGRNALQLGA